MEPLQLIHRTLKYGLLVASPCLAPEAFCRTPSPERSLVSLTGNQLSMSMEQLGGNIGPNAVNRVPDGRSLNAEPYQKLSVAEALSNTFSKEEAAAYTAMLAATSLAELRAGMETFNTVSTPKDASALGLSLDDMLIEDEPLSFGNVHDLPSDAEVRVSRTMHGETSFRIADKRAS